MAKPAPVPRVTPSLPNEGGETIHQTLVKRAALLRGVIPSIGSTTTVNGFVSEGATKEAKGIVKVLTTVARFRRNRLATPCTVIDVPATLTSLYTPIREGSTPFPRLLS